MGDHRTWDEIQRDNQVEALDRLAWYLGRIALATEALADHFAGAKFAARVVAEEFPDE